MAVRASMVAKAMREQRDALLAQFRPAVQEKRTKSPPREEDSRGSGSSKRARAEKCSDVEVRTGEWVDNAEKIVRDMRGDASSSSRDGDIGFASSVFKSSGGEDTLEMYRQTLRHDDQFALADITLVKLEDVAAYHSLATNAVIHHLLLRAAYLENELVTCKSKLNEANQKSEDRATTTMGPKLKELEKSLHDSKLKNAELQQRLDESNSRFKKLEQARERKREELFNAGRAAGRKEYLESEECRAAMKTIREEALKAFLKSNTYASLVAKRAAVYEFKGFSKCRYQAKKLGAFKKNFDPEMRLDPFKNENLEDPIIEDEVDAEEEEDEFAYLMKQTDQANSRKRDDY